MKIDFTKSAPDAQVPEYAHSTDAGADLRSVENVTLEPGERKLTATGVSVAIPEGYAGFITPRSGMANKTGVTVLNTPGLIDSGYRGELFVNLINHGYETVSIEAGSKIAQLVIQEVVQVSFNEVETLNESDRGSNGHGSTGL